MTETNLVLLTSAVLRSCCLKKLQIGDISHPQSLMASFLSPLPTSKPFCALWSSPSIIHISPCILSLFSKCSHHIPDRRKTAYPLRTLPPSASQAEAVLPSALYVMLETVAGGGLALLTS